jgi:hypothetical protein
MMVRLIKVDVRSSVSKVMNRQGFGVFVACTIDRGVPNLEKMVIWL